LDVLYRNLKPLVLASASPRRRHMLERLGLELRVAPSGVEETQAAGDGDPGTLAQEWAMEKAGRVADRLPDSWVLAADTVVALGDLVFGKPADEAEAVAMLESLSGKTHRVLSGMALVHRGEGVCRRGVLCTSVVFRSLRADEIRAYVRTGEPFDKAGGYGIQDLGAFLVRSIEGSYTNVVGLPLAETLDWLLDHEIIEPRRAQASAGGGIQEKGQ
jgi:septum formation protein